MLYFLHSTPQEDIIFIVGAASYSYLPSVVALQWHVIMKLTERDPWNQQNSINIVQYISYNAKHNQVTPCLQAPGPRPWDSSSRSLFSSSRAFFSSSSCFLRSSAVVALTAACYKPHTMLLRQRACSLTKGCWCLTKLFCHFYWSRIQQMEYLVVRFILCECVHA